MKSKRFRLFQEARSCLTLPNGPRKGSLGPYVALSSQTYSFSVKETVLHATWSPDSNMLI